LNLESKTGNFYVTRR